MGVYENSETSGRRENGPLYTHWARGSPYNTHTHDLSVEVPPGSSPSRFTRAWPRLERSCGLPLAARTVPGPGGRYARGSRCYLTWRVWNSPKDYAKDSRSVWHNYTQGLQKNATHDKVCAVTTSRFVRVERPSTQNQNKPMTRRFSKAQNGSVGQACAVHRGAANKHVERHGTAFKCKLSATT